MSFRRDYITKPIFSFARGVLPPMSDTEREALEAGDVWWDADLFTGDPDWSKLLAYPPATLTDEEKAFLNGPVDELCAMLDDWKINWEWRDLPPEAWEFIKKKKFFGDDHPEGAWRAWFFALRAFRSGAQAILALARGRRHRDGAELARARRIADAVRHQGAAGQMAAAPRRRPRDSLLRADQSGSRLGCRLDDRQRRHLQGPVRGPRSAGPQAELAQALHHARPGLDRCSGSPSRPTTPIISSEARKSSASPSR